MIPGIQIANAAGRGRRGENPPKSRFAPGAPGPECRLPAAGRPATPAHGLPPTGGVPLEFPRPEVRSGWGRLVQAGMLVLLLTGVSRAAEPIPKEYQLKAAFLYNFTKFVDWPAHRQAAQDAPLIIGVLGDNPFGEELAKAVAGRTQNGHAFVVTNLTRASAAPGVHLLFVPRGQEALLAAQGPALQAAGVLTVGESETFANQGGLITFVTEADKIRFAINRAAAERAGLKISSQLLQLAHGVRPKT